MINITQLLKREHTAVHFTKNIVLLESFEIYGDYHNGVVITAESDDFTKYPYQIMITNNDIPLHLTEQQKNEIEAFIQTAYRGSIYRTI